MNSRHFTRSPRRRLRAGRLERRSERHQRPAALAGGRGAPARKPHAFDALIVERRVGALTLDMLVASAQKKGPGLLKHGAL
jgi:hypothetical protein